MKIDWILLLEEFLLSTKYTYTYKLDRKTEVAKAQRKLKLHNQFIFSVIFGNSIEVYFYVPYDLTFFFKIAIDNITSLTLNQAGIAQRHVMVV